MNQNEIELRQLALDRKGSVCCSFICLAFMAGSLAAMAEIISCAEKKEPVCIFGAGVMGFFSLTFLRWAILCLIDSVKLTSEIKGKSPRPLAQEALLLGGADLVIEMPPSGDRGPKPPCGADIFK